MENARAVRLVADKTILLDLPAAWINVAKALATIRGTDYLELLSSWIVAKAEVEHSIMLYGKTQKKADIQRIKLTLPMTTVSDIYAVAGEKNIRYQSLLKQWLIGLLKQAAYEVARDKDREGVITVDDFWPLDD